MEPADLNHDARLETLLRRPAPPIADDGFSTRVLAALPAPVAQTERLRWLVEIWSAALGIVAAVAGLVCWPGSQADVTDSLLNLARNTALLADPTLLLAAAIATGGVCFALRPQAKGRPDSGRP